MKNNYIGYVLIIIFLIFLFTITRKPSLENIKEVKIAGQSIKVDLALTPEAQTQGLSGRSELKEDEGMLFVFDQPGKYLFWMKNMNFPIDIIWLAPSEGGDRDVSKIVYIKEDAQPENFLEAYGPDEDAKYVLEVVSGFSEKNNLKEGDRVEFIYH